MRFDGFLRILQFGNPQGGISLGQGDQYPTQSPAQYGEPVYAEDEEKDAGEKAKAMGMIMAVLVVSVVGMVFFTWGTSYISDHLCCCFPGFIPVSEAATFNAQFDRTPLARKARLWGLKLDERARILEAFFQKRIFLYQHKNQEQHLERRNEEVERLEEDEAAAPPTEKLPDAAAPGEHQNEPTGRTKETGDNTEEVDPPQDETVREEDMPPQDETVRPVRGGGDTGKSNMKVACSQNDAKTEVADRSDNQANEDETNTTLDEEEGLKDADHERICCICLNEYKGGDKLITGTQCAHIFHYTCCMEWLNKPHDQCPYCRVEMITASQFRKTAVEILDWRRITEMQGSGVTTYPVPATVAVPSTRQAQPEPTDTRHNQDSRSPENESLSEVDVESGPALTNK